MVFVMTKAVSNRDIFVVDGSSVFMVRTQALFTKFYLPPPLGELGLITLAVHKSIICLTQAGKF